MSKLRNKGEKEQKNSIKKLVKAEKGSTFAPATAKSVPGNTDKHSN